MKLIFPVLLASTLLLAGGRKDAPVDNGVRQAEVVRVVDGDTLVMNVYLGCGVGMIEKHVRLEGVHAFEANTKTGVEETAALTRYLQDNPSQKTVIQMHGNDKYGRLLGTVWIGDRNVNDFMKSQPQGGR